MKLQSLDVPDAVNRDRNHEIAKDTGAVGLQEVGLSEGHHEIGLSELPAIGERRRGWTIVRIAFNGALLEPPLNEIDLGSAQRMLSDEFTVVRLGLPGRH